MKPGNLAGCDLHVHLAGSFYAEDLLAIGAPIFREVDWTAREFLDGYNNSLETELDPVQLFAEALENPETGFPKLKAAYVFGPEDSGDFERFMWKYRLFSHLWSYGSLHRRAASTSPWPQKLNGCCAIPTLWNTDSTDVYPLPEEPVSNNFH